VIRTAAILVLAAHAVAAPPPEDPIWSLDY